MIAARRGRTIVLALIAGFALMGIALLGRAAPRDALSSYLAAYIFFLGPALGSMALLLVHALTGGRWGVDLRPTLLAAMRLLPLLAALLAPLLLGLGWLYPWAVSATANRAQQWYLNAPFFIARAVVCFALWLWIAQRLRRRLLSGQSSPSLPGFAAAALIIYLLTVTVASVDWIMSLTPAWHSSIFGLILGTSQMLAAAALAVVFGTRRGAQPLQAQRTGDLGSILLMLVLAWSYLAFMDYLTAWIADLPSETVWYLPRLNSSWHWLGAWLIVLHLAVPFAVLLSRAAKQSRAWLRGVALLLLSAQALFALWLVLPSLRPAGFALEWTDLLAFVGVGALCAARLQLELPA